MHWYNHASERPDLLMSTWSELNNGAISGNKTAKYLELLKYHEHKMWNKDIHSTKRCHQTCTSLCDLQKIKINVVRSGAIKVKLEKRIKIKVAARTASQIMFSTEDADRILFLFLFSLINAHSLSKHSTVLFHTLSSLKVMCRTLRERT